jgi:NhaP-type Na+/H+ or K+/H+ antiporter
LPLPGTRPCGDFRYNFVSIFLLAFGLVGFTVAAVAVVALRLFYGFDWRLGFVLGAIVAPTDAIAAVAIARQVGLPSRIADTIEGESSLTVQPVFSLSNLAQRSCYTTGHRGFLSAY